MRFLYVTTIGGTMRFFKKLIQELVASGNTVDIATNDRESAVPEEFREMGCKVHTLDCERSPFASGNTRAVRQIRELVIKGNYGIVHCHTPIAAVCTRLACWPLRKRGVRVFYTAHGFHFYTGAPLKNWALYYPVEWLCSWLTDVLVCITQEDYIRAKKHLHANRTVYVPGVGVDVSSFTGIDGKGVREELGLKSHEILLLSVGELNQNKNHQIVIRALPDLPRSIHYAIAGEGENRDELLALAKELGVLNRLHLLGYRKDIAKLMGAANIYILPSLREGLNVSLTEAMASSLPCLASDIRGNRDLIKETNLLFNPKRVDEAVFKIKQLLAISNDDATAIIKSNQNAVRHFDTNTVCQRMLCLYSSEGHGKSS